MIRRALLTSVACLALGCSLGGQSGTESLDVKQGDDPAPDAGNVLPGRPDAGPVTPGPDLSLADGGTPNRREVNVDFYREPCGPKGSMVLCARLSSDEDSWAANPDFNWSDFVWGHRYSLMANSEFGAVDAGAGASANWVIDKVVIDEPVGEGTRFVLPVDPNRAPAPFVSVTSGSQGAIENGPKFRCEPELCEALSEALDATAEFDAVFRFDAETKLVLAELSGDELSAPLNEFQVIRQDWLAAAPEQYVVKTCSTGFATPRCELWAVEAETVVSSEEQLGVWETRLLTGEEELPLAAIIDRAKAESRLDCDAEDYAVRFSLDPEYGYVSEFYRHCREGSGIEVKCFAADTLDPEACRDE